MLTLRDLEAPAHWYQDEYDCISVKPAYRFESGKQTNELIGYRYEVLLKHAENELCKVLVFQQDPLFTTEELKLEGGTKPIRFVGLCLIPYQNYFYKKRVFIRGEAMDVKEMEDYEQNA